MGIFASPSPSCHIARDVSLTVFLVIISKTDFVNKARKQLLFLHNDIIQVRTELPRWSRRNTLYYHYYYHYCYNYYYITSVAFVFAPRHYPRTSPTTVVVVVVVVSRRKTYFPESQYYKRYRGDLIILLLLLLLLRQLYNIYR